MSNWSRGSGGPSSAAKWKRTLAMAYAPLIPRRFDDTRMHWSKYPNSLTSPDKIDPGYLDEDVYTIRIQSDYG